MLGVDAIIHVASPLANTGAPQVILDVRDADLIQVVIFSLTSRNVFLVRCLRYHSHP
jgi:hypothetical protein